MNVRKRRFQTRDAIIFPIYLFIGYSFISLLYALKNLPENSYSHSAKGKFMWLSLDDSRMLLAKFGNDHNLVRNRRICFVTAGLLGPSKYGGIGHAVSRQAILYAKSGAHVDILYTGGFQVANRSFWSKFYGSRGVNLFFLPSRNEKMLYGTIRMKLSYAVLQWFLANQRDTFYHLIIFHDLFGYGIFVQYSKLSGIGFQNTSIVVHAHGSSRMSDFFNARLPVDGINGLVTYSMERISLELAEHIWSPSEFYYKWMLKNGYNLEKTERHLTLELLMPQNEMFQSMPSGKSPIKSSKFGFFGRVDRLKGVFTFLDAIDYMVTDQYLNVPEEIYIVGDSALVQLDGKYVNSLAYIRKVRLKRWNNLKVLIFSNLSSVDAIKMFLDRSIIFVNPTNGETASTTTLEMINAGVPIISSNSCALPEFFKIQTIFDKWSFQRGDHIKLAYLMNDAMKYGIDVNLPRVTPFISQLLYIQAAEKAINDSKKHEIQGTLYNVTIGICTRNREDYLVSLLQSLAHQREFPVSTELIVVDVASHEIAKLEKLRKKYFEVFKRRNVLLLWKRIQRKMHISACRNHIMNLSSSTHIIYIDDDDLAHPRMTLLFHRAIQATGADLITGFAQVVNLDGPTMELKHLSLSIGPSKESSLLIHHMGKSNLMVNRNILAESGACTVDELNAASPFVDWDMYVKLVSRDIKVHVIPEATFYYRYKSKNSIYYSSISQNDLIYYAHNKRIESFCKTFKVPMSSCASLTYGVQSLAKPASIS